MVCDVVLMESRTDMLMRIVWVRRGEWKLEGLMEDSMGPYITSPVVFWSPLGMSNGVGHINFAI